MSGSFTSREEVKVETRMRKLEMSPYHRAFRYSANLKIKKGVRVGWRGLFSDDEKRKTNMIESRTVVL